MSDTLEAEGDWRDLIAASEENSYDKRARLIEAALSQLCANHGGAVSIPMLPISMEFIGDCALECRYWNGAYEFRLRKR